MYCAVHSMGLMGIDGYPVTVEASLERGMPSFDLVGLPDAAVRESKDRVRAVVVALCQSFPTARLIVNLAPADTRKTGSVYDLPILVAILQATGFLQAPLEEAAFLGELSLSGGVRPVDGVLSMVLAAREQGLRQVYVPAGNGAEASVVKGIAVYPVESARQLLEHLAGDRPIRPLAPSGLEQAPPQGAMPDFAEVRGQEEAKRGLEVAAAGGHNLLLIGPPGTGKSMLAKRLPSILPPLDFDEAVETTRIHSIAGLLAPGTPLISQRPFRSPHHTVSPAGLTGGGSYPRPGEISLAHNGVLFLDEMPEFEKRALEVLRQPLEDGTVTIARAGYRVTYPSAVMLVGAMNPCPCGYYGHPTRACTCNPAKIALYLGKISGPLLDRLDLHIEVPPVEYSQLADPAPAESSAAIRERVLAARQRQRERMAGLGISCNARIPPAKLRQLCPLTGEAGRLLQNAFDKLGMSARSYDRVLKVARTIADLDGSDVIQADHRAEAVQYRGLDRKYWERERALM